MLWGQTQLFQWQILSWPESDMTCHDASSSFWLQEWTGWTGREMALARAWSTWAGKRAFRSLEDVRCVAWSQSQQCRLPCRPKHVRTAVIPSQPLVLNASDPELKHLFEEGPMEAAYANTFLANIHGQQQGLLLQKWAMQTLQETHPGYEFSDPDQGTCCNGSKRGAGNAAYDFLMNGRRVEIKSSRMSRNERENRWRIFFTNIKLPTDKRTVAAFDDLFLVIASPNCLLLIQHDLCTGMRLSGKLGGSRGLALEINASVNDVCLTEALETIVEKLCEKGSCKLIAKRCFDDAQFQQLLEACIDCREVGQAAYDGVPMCRMSSCRRGLQIQEMGLVIDKRLNPKSVFTFLTVEYTVEGHLRGAHRASVDWIRDKILVELKSSKLYFDKRRSQWKCVFRSIKPDCFDELWLAIYKPWGIGFYKSALTERLRLASQGIRTKDEGFQLELLGPAAEEDPLRALEVIEGKLLLRGFVAQGVVEWEAGSFVKVKGGNTKSFLPRRKENMWNRQPASTLDLVIMILRYLRPEGQTWANWDMHNLSKRHSWSQLQGIGSRAEKWQPEKNFFRSSDFSSIAATEAALRCLAASFAAGLAECGTAAALEASMGSRRCWLTGCST